MSDLVLNTVNSNGKELHASKHVLATHSPYFQAMFFGAEWAEKSSNSLELDDDYEVVKEALRVIYHVGRSYGSPKFHPPDELLNLYIFADKRDFPMIREMCKEELVAQPTDESVDVAQRLDLLDVVIKLYRLMREKEAKELMELRENLERIETEMRQLEMQNEMERQRSALERINLNVQGNLRVARRRYEKSSSESPSSESSSSESVSSEAMEGSSESGNESEAMEESSESANEASESGNESSEAMEESSESAASNESLDSSDSAESSDSFDSSSYFDDSDFY